MKRERITKRKSNTGLSLGQLKPQTKKQESAFAAFDVGKHLLMVGPAGVGKTIIALYLALNEVIARRASRLIIVRSVLPSRDIGFMPGNLNEKAALYEAPYADACSFLYGRDDAYQCLKSCYVEFMTTSFARGVTLRDAIVFIDEAQNMLFHEMDTMITRTGENTRLIVCGDANQTDLVRAEEQRGFTEFCSVLRDMDSFSDVVFDINDVQRSDLVKEYLKTRNRVLSRYVKVQT